MEISLMSNNSGASKIPYVVVFVDMAGDLGVMVERSNSPFVLQLVQLILYTMPDCGRSTFSCAFGQWFEGDLDLLLP